MPTPTDPIITHQARRSMERLRPRLESIYFDYIQQNPRDWWDFSQRLDRHFERLFGILVQVYGKQYDFFYHLEALLHLLVQSWIERPAGLKELDQQREADPCWFQSNKMLGGVCYVDLFAGDLNGIRQRIPYFKELGLTYLHLMPLFLAPQGENDGGYAISSYREVNPALGTMQQLSGLASALRKEGISLVVDFVFNHTSHEHEWALKARQGNLDFQDFYRMYLNREMPDAYERTLREIFPDEHPGAFTYFPEIDRWVWTTFHSYQWDLNYANPEVFNRMAEELLLLANAGVEVIRLDAVAFIWKQMGTSCENLPEAHMLIQAFNAVTRIATPSMIFKSEAIVHPDEVVRYIHPDECQLSYNPLLMALLWNTLATRDVSLLQYSMMHRFKIDPRSAWVNYVRCHDDIGWTFSDEDALRLGINGFDHRRFLNNFYTGRFKGSFARGLPFQENPATGDARISGACASLAGLEKALAVETGVEVELALRRILLIHAIILSIGGIPLIYLGDEIAMVNDYSYRADHDKVNDSRWVHRPAADWNKYARRSDENSMEGWVYTRLRKLIELRKSNPAFSGQETEIINIHNPHVFGYLRHDGAQRVLVLCNFIEEAQSIDFNELRLYGLGYSFTDLVSGSPIAEGKNLVLEPYQFVWLL
ncbi:MAG TPA: alpha-amylase family glycosyl hydrolase [Levilinea sp.]|nr:alpha-amylase family glycosyl hydrolase [Levilinea sp.]